MARRKRPIDVEDDSHKTKEKETSTEVIRPLRRTRQKIANPVELKPKVSGRSTSNKPESNIKKPRRIKKISEDKAESDHEHNSPNSTDSGISSGPNTKNENFPQLLTNIELAAPVKMEIPTFFESTNRISNVDSDNSDYAQVEIKKEKISKKRSKRKIVNLDNSVSIDKRTLKNVKLKQESGVKAKGTIKRLKKESKESLNLENPTNFVNNNAALEVSPKEESVMQVLTRLEFEDSGVEDAGVKKLEKIDCKSDSSNDSDWEEVEESKDQNLEAYNPVIPKDGVEITIDCPELNSRKRKKKQFDEMEYIRLYINRERKEHQLNIHKTHLLCLIAHGLYVNDVLNSSILKAYALSLIPADISALTTNRKIDKIDSKGIEKVVSWFCNSFTFENETLPFLNISDSMSKYFQDQRSLNASEYNLMFIVIARALGFKTRFCVSFYPVSYKAKNLLKKPSSKKENSKSCKTSKDDKCMIEDSSDTANVDKKIAKKSKILKVVKNASATQESTSQNKKRNSKRSVQKNYKVSSEESGSDDEDFVPETKTPKKVRQTSNMKNQKRQSNRKILSTDSEPSSPENCSLKFDKIVCWSEVFSKSDKHWVSVECTNFIIGKPYDIEKLLPQPVTYIVAFDNDSYIKDLTRRYCNEYMTSTLKLRTDSDWWEETLEPFSPPNSKLDKEEEKKLDDMLINKPLPHTVAGFKNHPLYALKRHLLKFEAIYPPDAAPVGFLRGEPIYARECVCQLHSRETWLKEARVVRIGEEPYKIVKARPKWDRINCVVKTDIPLEIFGFWQTEPYKPPVAVGGKVPRNEYGNVELFKPCMLPKGTVHLQNPGLNRIAKKLGIDCCAAVVGFDGHKGSVHPVFDGFIVCEEYQDTLLAAWEEEQVNARKREEEKREKRIYGNWKKLIKGLLIRERIKLKYNVE